MANECLGTLLFLVIETNAFIFNYGKELSEEHVRNGEK